LLDKSFCLKITDFGLSRIQEMRTMTTVGTPHVKKQTNIQT